MGRLKRLQHIGIKVSDIENSMAFYRDVLGLKVSERHEPGKPPGIRAFASCGANAIIITSI